MTTVKKQQHDFEQLNFEQEQNENGEENEGDYYEESFQEINNSGHNEKNKTIQTVNKNQPPSKANNYNQKNQPPSKANNYNQNIKPKIEQVKEQQKIQIHQQQQNDDDYNDDDARFEQPEQQQHKVYEAAKPQQNDIVLLKNKEQHKFQEPLKVRRQQEYQQTIEKQIQKNLKESVQSYQHQAKMSQDQLERLYKANQIEIKKIKEKIAEQKATIRQIGASVDKDIEKSIIKISNKSKAVNIKDFFSEFNINGTNQKTNKLKQELISVRNLIKKTKNQSTAIQATFTDPIFMQNMNKAEELTGKLKIITQEASKKAQQKRLLAQQIQRMRQGLNISEQQQYQASYSRNQQAHQKVLNQIKEQRAKIYRQQKQDIILMQKLKFLGQRYQKIHVKSLAVIENQETECLTKEEIQKQMKQIIESINETLDEKNKIENQRIKILKTLTSDVPGYEELNLTTLNQIRNIDSYLLQFYTHNIQKNPKNLGKGKKLPQTAEKLNETIDNQSQIVQSTQISVEINDKNVSSGNKFRTKIKVKKNQIQKKDNSLIIEKDLKKSENPKKFKQTKKQYHFGDLKIDQKGAILSDQILGKVKLRQLNLFVDQKHLYGIQCKYFNDEKPQIIGVKICQKNGQQKCEKLTLSFAKLKNQEYLQSIKVGYSQKNQITFISFVSSNNKSLNWGNQESATKIDLKNLQVYSSITLKAKLMSIEEPKRLNKLTKNFNQITIDKPKLKLVGLGFSVLELQNQE